MPTLVYTSPDLSRAPIIFSRDATDYKLLLAYSGFTETPVEHKTIVSPGQHGATVADSLMQPRTISFSVMVQGATLAAVKTLITTLSNTLNPLNGTGTLQYVNDDGNTYLAYVRGSGNTVVPDTSTAGRGATYQKVTVTLVAYDPFWYSGVSHLLSLSAAVVSFIPWYIPWYIGGQAATGTANNSGSQETPVQITFNGPITNPVLSRSYTIAGVTTTETISLTITLLAGEKVVIQSGDGQQSCFYYDTSGVEHLGEPYVDIASMYWQLKPGANSITFSCGSSGTQNDQAVVIWADRYTGV